MDDGLTLPIHEAHSQARYEALSNQIKEATKMDGNISDKLNINVGEGGMGGGGNMAALLAAMNNGRNDNNWWPLLLLLGFNRGRGGFGGGDDCAIAPNGDSVPFRSAVLTSLNQLSTLVPTTALETQAAITGAISQLALGMQQGFSNVKDSVQNIGALNLTATNNVNTAVLTTGLQTQIAIGNDGDKTRALIESINNANLNRQLAVAESALLEERFNRRSRDIEVNVTQTVNQNNAQLQFQQQQQQQFQVLANLSAVVANLANDIQVVRQGQTIFNSGTMAASGTQAAANTKVN